ncbi:MAG: NnrS family protein [Telluria sp.]|nr:NnrS family protein [Telluria sp.]
MSLLSIEEPVPPPTRATWLNDHPFWRLGFRPFYLCAAVFAALSLPLWVARFLGVLDGLPNVGLGWHMHEMVYGVIIAVIIGFLFTAGRAWTGLQTPRRGHLAALVALWLAGRVAMLVAPPLLAALVDLLFVPLAAWPMYRVLQQSGNKRNLFLAGLLGLLTLINACYHAGALGLIALPPATPIHAAILVVVVIQSVIGARVIPMFTRNGAPGTEPVVNVRRDIIALTLTVLAGLSWVAGLPAPLAAAFAAGAACATALRVAGWQPHRTLHVPLLWILHLSYAWIPVGFVLLALAELGMVGASAPFHALAVGSTAGLIIGMMTRTTLGHTGRALKAGRSEVAMYWLIQLGALARLSAAVGPDSLQRASLLAATVCWTLAFTLFAVVYAPYLWRARLDGRDG